MRYYKNTNKLSSNILNRPNYKNKTFKNYNTENTCNPHVYLINYD